MSIDLHPAPATDVGRDVDRNIDRGTEVLRLLGEIEMSMHRRLRESLPPLNQFVERTLTTHSANWPPLGRLAPCYVQLHRDLSTHLQREEEFLFPLIRSLVEATSHTALPDESVAGRISLTLLEHELLRDLFREMRSLASNYHSPQAACPALRALYRGLAQLEHDTQRLMAEENQRLFPLALAEERRTRDLLAQRSVCLGSSVCPPGRRVLPEQAQRVQAAVQAEALDSATTDVLDGLCDVIGEAQ